MLKKQKKIILFVLQGNGKEDSANTGKNIQKFISFTRRQLFQGEGKGTSEDQIGDTKDTAQDWCNNQSKKLGPW